MKFYKNQHKYYCGIDLHAKQMYVCVIDREGKVLVHKNIKTEAGRFLNLIAPYREDLVVAVECVYCWYWLADLCHGENIPFVLGHALYMKAIHGGKTKNDKIDSEKIAVLLRGGMLPLAYACASEFRGARDMTRRRLYFVRHRAELSSHVKMTYQQYNLVPPVGELKYKKTRDKVSLEFKDPHIVQMVQSDLEMIEHYSTVISRLESRIEAAQFKKGAFGLNISLLRTIPGIGKSLAPTIMYEINDISRFKTVQNFISYSRLVKPKKTSAGKLAGGGGSKIGNRHLKWAFSEAVLIHLRDDARGKAYMDKLIKKHPKGKAMSIMAAKIARSAYFILKRKTAFNEEQFFKMAA